MLFSENREGGWQRLQFSRASGPVPKIVAVLWEEVVVYEPKETEFEAPKRLVLCVAHEIRRPTFQEAWAWESGTKNRQDHPECLSSKGMKPR